MGVSEIEKSMLLTEFQSSLLSISQAYEAEFSKLNKHVTDIAPAVFKIQKLIHGELLEAVKEVEKQKIECRELISSLRSASRELKKFLKDYDEDQIVVVLQILHLIQKGKLSHLIQKGKDGN